MTIFTVHILIGITYYIILLSAGQIHSKIYIPHTQLLHVLQVPSHRVASITYLTLLYGLVLEE